MKAVTPCSLSASVGRIGRDFPFSLYLFPFSFLKGVVLVDDAQGELLVRLLSRHQESLFQAGLAAFVRIRSDMGGSPGPERTLPSPAPPAAFAPAA